MSDAAQPTAAEVRAAADAVKAALDHHLEAVERRSGDDDPAVYDAFNALAAAAEVYDELLYDRYDEVTPFEIPGVDDSMPPYTGPEEPNALSVLIRRDYAVVEPPRLLAQAQRIADADPGDGGRGPAPRPGPVSMRRSVCSSASTNRTRSPPGTRSSAWRRATPRSGSRRPRSCPRRGSGSSAPFDEADPQLVVCRFDVSSVFDEDDLDEELDDLAADSS